MTNRSKVRKIPWWGFLNFKSLNVRSLTDPKHWTGLKERHSEINLHLMLELDCAKKNKNLSITDDTQPTCKGGNYPLFRKLKGGRLPVPLMDRRCGEEPVICRDDEKPHLSQSGACSNISFSRDKLMAWPANRPHLNLTENSWRGGWRNWKICC